jgi:hypothetical protein
MSDMHGFEERLATRLREYAAPAARPPAPEAVARAVSAARQQRNGFAQRLRWSAIGRRPRLWILAAGLLLTGLLGGTIAGSLVPRPDEAVVPPVPAATATPTMAGVQGSENRGSWQSMPCAADDSAQAGQPSALAGPAPAGTPRPGDIAFQATSADGASRVALLDPTSGEVTAITPPLHELALRDSRFNPGDFFVTDLSWSPDGRALLFQLNRGPGRLRDNCGIYVVSADGAQLRRLELAGFERASPADQAWAPDGSRVAVESGGSIAILSLDGSPVMELGYPVPCEEGCSVALAGWSPDGELIAAGFCCLDVKADGDDSNFGVAVANVQDGSWTILSTSGWSDVLGWLPDGSVAANLFSWDGVYALHPDRPGERTLLPFKGAREGGRDRERVGQIELWSPDRSHDVIFPEHPADNVQVRDLLTGEFTEVTRAVLRVVTWSPDSAQLAFVREGFELWVIAVDGSNRRRVGTVGSNVFGHIGDLAWQPAWP